QVGKAQNSIVGVGNHQLLHKVLILDSSGALATTTPVLGLIVLLGLCLGIAQVGQDDHHAFFRNQVRIREILLGVDDFSTTRIPIFTAYFFQLLTDHFEQTLGIVQDFQELANLLDNVPIFGDDLVGFQAGQFLQP